MDKKGKLLSKRFTTPEDRENKINIQALISSAVLKQKELKKLENEAENNKYLKGFFSGKYNDSNLYYYIKGLQALKVLINGGLSAYEIYISNKENQNKHEVSAQVITKLAREIANASVDGLITELNSRYENRRSVYRFEQACKIVEEGRDIVTKEVQRDDIKVQKNMSAREIFEDIEDLVETIDRKGNDALNFYMSLGTDVISFIGAMTEFAKNDKRKLLLIGGLNAIQNGAEIVDRIIDNSKRTKLHVEDNELRAKERREKEKFLSITPTNREDLEKTKQDVIKAIQEEKEWQTKYNKYGNGQRIKSEAVSLAMFGVIVGSELSKCKKDLNPSTISKIMLKIMSDRSILKLGTMSINNGTRLYWWYERYRNDLERALNIARQIQEKNDELLTPTGEITSVEFKDFRGEFYKSQVGEEEIPECVINIPSMKLETGKVVLLTGNSGSGKSTILKFLRDGDIGNKGQIIVNGTDRVDKLGRDIVSMCEAKMNLCSYNALQDITGKVRMKDLSKEEQAKLKDILFDLGLSQDKTEKDEFISKCEYKTYEQFSTGQQKRLELAKALFSINDNSQVVLLDETVSNIQRELGEGAFKLINKYTKKGKPKIVVMVSHNIEMASIYADKRYHIDENHTLVEMPVRKTELELE